MGTRLKIGALESSDDSGDLRRGTGAWLGREEQPIQLASIYGLVHNPPDGSQLLLLSQNDQESNSIGIPDHPAIRPLKGLAKGEVAVVNYLTGAYSLHKANGDIEVKTTGAGNINLNGVIIDSNGNITLPAGATITTSGGGHMVDNGKIMATHQHNETGTVTSAPI